MAEMKENPLETIDWFGFGPWMAYIRPPVLLQSEFPSFVTHVLGDDKPV